MLQLSSNSQPEPGAALTDLRRGSTEPGTTLTDLRRGSSEPGATLTDLRRGSSEPGTTLVDLRRGDTATLNSIDLPREDARRLMELGFLPGIEITAGRSAPGGDPRVFQVDGSEIALRRETARLLKIGPARKSKKS